MQFSDTTTRTGLIQDCEDLTGLGATGISGNATLLQTFTRYVNEWYLKAVGWMIGSSHKWSFDDSNYTNLPRAYTTMVADQRDYTLPPAVASGNADTFLRLIKLSVLDSSGDEQVIRHSQEPEAVLLESFQSSGMPQFYKMVGNTIKLFPAPSASMTTLTAGLICYFERSVDLFTTADTTQHPGIPEIHHRILSLGASYDYLISQGDTAKANIYRQEIEQKKTELQKFEVGKNLDVS
jgi:hypothetical protein